MKDRLSSFIEKKGLTATKFASVLDVNPSAISHLLNGRNKPRTELLVKILEAFPEINLNWLLTGEGNMYKGTPGTPEIKTESSSSKRTDPLPSLFPEASIPEVLSQPEKPIEKKEISEQSAPYVPVNQNYSSGKKVRRILILFEDGSFEDYLP